MSTTTTDWTKTSEFQTDLKKRRDSNRIVTIAKRDYWAQFDDYDNVEVHGGFRDETFTLEGLKNYPEVQRKDFMEKVTRDGWPHKHGLELERGRGYIRITEDRPIIAASVLGSGCASPSYVICEYPQPGESFEEPHRCEKFVGYNMQNLRRQRVDGLRGLHPSPLVRALGQDIIAYEMDFEPRSFESSVFFEIEPTTTVTLRGGSGDGSHFAFRMIRIYFEVELP